MYRIRRNIGRQWRLPMRHRQQLCGRRQRQLRNANGDSAMHRTRRNIGRQRRLPMRHRQQLCGRRHRHLHDRCGIGVAGDVRDRSHFGAADICASRRRRKYYGGHRKQPGNGGFVFKHSRHKRHCFAGQRRQHVQYRRRGHAMVSRRLRRHGNISAAQRLDIGRTAPHGQRDIDGGDARRGGTSLHSGQQYRF